MSDKFKTIGEQIMEDYVMDRQKYVENGVTGSLSRDQLERYLNISQYVGRVADQMEVPFTRDWQEKGKCLLGVKFSCQVGMFRKFFWRNIEDQLSSVKAAKGQDNKAVISFNCFYKVDHLNEMLKKLTEDGDFDVVCMQELCGPWLVTNGEYNKSHVKKGEDGNFTACGDDDKDRILPQNTKGRMLNKGELQNMVNIINQDLPPNVEPQPVADDAVGGGLSSKSNLIRPSKIRIDAHNNKKNPNPLNWYRTQEELIKYINEQKKKLKEGKEPVTDIRQREGGFDSVEWAKWWLDSFEDGYTIIYNENSCYVTARFKKVPGYSIIFAPANHTNGFFLCSFGNAIIYRTKYSVGRKQIMYSEEPVCQCCPHSAGQERLEGRNALKVEIDGINYICMHLDEKATWESQITMLQKWIEEGGLFNEECIVCGDMNVMDISISPIRDLLEEPKFNDYEVGPVMPLNGEVPLAPVNLKDRTNKARCTTLWKLFEGKGLNSIYDHAGKIQRHMITVANAGGVDYVGYSPQHFTFKKTGVIFPVLPGDVVKGNSTGGIQELVGQHNYISDHLLPFLVFKKEEKSRPRWRVGGA